MSTEIIIKQPKFDEDDQLDIMAALAFIQLNHRFSPPSMPDSPTISSDERRMLSILTWISMFFVTEPRGDCIASALSVEASKITLYLATNRGRPRDEDIKTGTKLISALHQAFHEPDPETAQLGLFDSSVSNTYRRLTRKFDMITNIGLPKATPATKTFEVLMTKWAGAKGVEQNQELILFTRSNYSQPLATYESGGEGIYALKVLFETFVKSVEVWRSRVAGSGVYARLLAMAFGICQIATRLVYSDFFSDVVLKMGVELFDAEEYNWLRKLRRRLWRVARYWLDAGSVATAGTKWIRRILGDNGLTEGGDDFRVVWVGLDPHTLPEGHGVQYIFPQRPQERFDALLQRFGFEGLNQTKQIKNPGFTSDLGSLWSKKKPGYTPGITPFFHCELQLISYLDQRNITAHMNLIGVSKLMCWACNTYVEELNKRKNVDSKNPYVLSGTSGKAHNAWLIPPGELRGVIVERIGDALRDAISRLANKLGHRRVHSGGSTGSMERVIPSDSGFGKASIDRWSVYKKQMEMASNE